MNDISVVLEQPEVFQILNNLDVEVHIWHIERNNIGEIYTWRLVYINPITLSSWGFSSADELIGKTTDEIFGEGAAEHYLDVVKKISTTGEPHRFTDYFSHLDKHFRFTSIPSGEYFITTGDDISDFVKANESAQEEITELSREVRQNREKLRLSREELAQQEIIQKERQKIYSATVFGAQHILNNLLNQLQIVNFEIERHPSFDPEVIKAIHSMLDDAKGLMTKLSSVEHLDDEAIRQSVQP